MFGGSSFGGTYFGGFPTGTTEILIDSERDAQITGSQDLESERDAELTGATFIDQPLLYHVIAKDENGNRIGEFQVYRMLRFGKRLNNYGKAEISLPVSDPKLSTLVSLRRYTIEIYRQQGTQNQLVWAGEQALRSAELNPDKNNWGSLLCFDWLEQLNQRFTASEVTFTEEDAGEIAWQLIDITQSQTNGDYGITEGTIEPTKDRDRSYFNDNIMEAIINLSGVISGFDFEITNDKVFNVKSVLGTDRTDSIVLEYGKNITNVRITEDFVHPVNRAIVIGVASDEVTLQRIDRDDTDLQDDYKVREGRFQEMDISEMETFEDKGDAAIRKYGLPLIKVDFDLVRSSNPNITQFGLGDGVRLIIQSGIYNIDEEYRVFEWEVEFDEKNTERLSLILGKLTI